MIDDRPPPMARAAGTVAAVYRFLLRPSWIGLLLAAFAVAAGCVGLGNWQLDRLADRQDFNAAVELAQDAGPVPAASLLSADQPVDSEAQWRRVTATGRYDVANEVLLRGQLDTGRAGFHVLTPLVTDDGTALLVNRGWIPIDRRGDATSAPDVPPPPEGDVSVLGRVRQLQPVRAARAVPTGDSVTLASVDLLELADDLPYPMFSAYVELLEQQPSGQAQPEPVDPPELSAGPHLAYAVQWFLFSGLGFLGYVVFARQEAQRRTGPVRSGNSATE
jgi:cytochrome oxidase assembly protein ShyY1